MKKKKSGLFLTVLPLYLFTLCFVVGTTPLHGGTELCYQWKRFFHNMEFLRWKIIKRLQSLYI